MLVQLRMAAFSIGCGAALLAGAPDRAAACSGPSCVGPEFFPGRGSVPANLPAVLFWPPARWGDGSNDAGPDSVASGDVRFVRLEGTTGAVEVAFELIPSDEPSTRVWAGSNGAPAYRIVPAVELQPGARYAVWATDCSGGIPSDPPREPYESRGSEDAVFDGVSAPHAPFAVFDVIAAAAQPTELGSVTLSASMQREVQLGGGSGCWDRYEAATVLAEVERAGNPFFDAMAFTTYVDGKVYRPSPHLNSAPAYGDSWVGHGRDLLAALCAPDRKYPLLRGTHTVRFEGRIAGSDETLVSENLDFELSCPDSVDRGGALGDGGQDAPPSGTIDGGSAEGGHDARDAAAAPTRDAEARAREQRSAGGCSVGGDASGGVLATLLALVYLCLRSRGVEPGTGPVAAQVARRAS
jgi:hypothetical protein